MRSQERFIENLQKKIVGWREVAKKGEYEEERERMENTQENAEGVKDE